MKNKKKDTERYAPTREEFHETVQREFSFLVSELGFSQEIPKDSSFTATYHRDNLRIRISGINYGFGAYLELFVNDESVSLRPNITSMTERKTCSTNRPQLDDVREYAWRLLHECHGLLVGDPTLSAKFRSAAEEHRQKWMEARLSDDRNRFFSVADKLFRAGQYSEVIQHLESSSCELSQVWAARLDYARKHAARYPWLPVEHDSPEPK